MFNRLYLIADLAGPIAQDVGAVDVPTECQTMPETISAIAKAHLNVSIER
jgi:hypothetical protein